MTIRRNYIKKIIQSILMLNIVISVHLYAQVANYTEVNVYGWGQAMDRGVAAFCDIDNDGYMDMLVGNNDGNIWHLEQTTDDNFAIISRKFSDIDVGSEASPTFAYIDNDSLLDLIIGGNSNLEWYEQDEKGSNTFVFISDDLISVDPGAHWTPAIADLNNDGLLELILGESLGTLWYFEQDSLNAGTFSLVDEKWLDWDGGVYVHPYFTDLNGDSLLDMLVGASYGKMFHFIQDSINTTSFNLVDEDYARLGLKGGTVPCIIDIDNDHKLDFYVGEWYKGIFHYEQSDSASDEYILLSDQIFGLRDFGSSISYTIFDIDGDSLLDMLVGAYNGADAPVLLYEQDEIGSLNFVQKDDQFNDIEVTHYSDLTIYDINGNNLLDLLVSDVQGYIKRYEQDSPNSYTFLLVDEEFNNNMKLYQSAHLTFSYIDDDSLLDMIAGEGNGYLFYYEQDSINAVTFTKQIDHFLNQRLLYASPEFTDIDGDSLLDLIIGNSWGLADYYEQVSPNSLEFTLVTNDFGTAYYGNRTILRFADVNNDGKTDMFASENAGGITLHLRNDDLDITAPDIPQNVSAVINGNYVDISWSPSIAEDVLLYNIYRSSRNDTAVAEYLNSVDFDVVSFTDSTIISSGTYYYWLTALDLLGNESGFSKLDSVDISIVSIAEGDILKPENFALFQNYPNPFNPATTIGYQLPKTSQVELSVYNMLGQKVVTLVSQQQNAGTYYIQWHAGNLASGVYYYKFTTDKGFEITRKLVLLK